MTIPGNDAQTLMLDIRRLTYRVSCGKVSDNPCHAQRYDEKLASSLGTFRAPELDLDC